MTGVRIGLDFGTSGCRGVALDDTGAIRALARVAMPEPERRDAAVEQAPTVWWTALEEVVAALTAQLNGAPVEGIAIDGTSGTLLLADADGEPLTPALLYNDARASAEGARIDAVAPATSPARGATSALARLLWLHHHTAVDRPVAHALHQADWLAGRLCGQFGHSDSNNALKLGWNPTTGEWPGWLRGLLDREGIPIAWLPRVHTPGARLGTVPASTAERLGLPAGVAVVAGTTDSTAAVLAAGAREPGDAVTILGSTLVLKVVGERPVADADAGIYSQPFGDFWLIGGASNSGGAVLREHFSDARMVELEPRLDPAKPTGLDYYPLPAPGERFPFRDPALAPRLEPRPADDGRFFQGLLEGMAAIEAAGYRRLAEQGAPPPRRVLTLGGGARNAGWAAIRQRMLGIEVTAVADAEPAAGTATLVPQRSR
jgi:sugar (pentulose or hexulose) kinase